MTTVTHDKRWWSQPLSAAFEALASGPGGLPGAEAAARHERYGPNRFRDRPTQSLLLQFLKRFRNPLVIVLLVASAIAATMGEVASFAIIAVVILISVTLDFVQEHRANRAAERLRQSVAVRATVIRDGNRREIMVSELVPGDVVQLSAGDIVPADGRVIEARDFFLNQALLTGEPFPVEKRAAEPPTPEGGALTAPNTVFMSTSVISGTARVLVCRTGKRTEVAGIAASLTREPPPTGFEIGTRRFGLLIMRLTIFMVLFVLLVNTLFARPLLESFLFAVALAVGLTPELLPMVVTVTLARGARRMADQGVIVKRLAAIQNLGSMDVLCTDKTGTLTEARIRLERHVDALGRDSERVLELAYLNSHFETGLKSPLDDAILEHSEIDVSGWRKIDEVPFDFERRRVSVLVEKAGERLLVVKGAPEDILRLSVHYENGAPDVLAEFDTGARAAIEAQHDALGREGFRVLAIAWRRTAPDHAHAVVDDETELVFAGFAAFLDPPKKTAADTLQALTGSGVAVKIVTGDNERVTQYICGKLGVTVTGVVTGAEIAKLGDASLAARAEKANLFCRITPAQKSRIILALKSRGHIVGYLGDGINDAPSLHNADVGLSVDTAVDVARAAADMILLEHDLKVLHEGVVEGRRTFGNIMKYIMMGTSSNFGNMFSMAGASLFLPFLPMTPAQILLNNMLYDISEVPIPLDRVDEAETRAPRRLDMDFIRNFMLVMGPVSSLFDFLTFYLLLAVLNANEALFRTGWFIESLATQVLVIFVIRTRRNPLTSLPHPALAVVSLAVVALAAILPFTPLGVFFGFVPPPAEFYYMLAALLICYLILAQAVKMAFYRRFARL
ncbi:MAG TPA: magnesium-translocating P-type ATPase [Burkholderiales bacterium]|nr:magnesium-translocating P-type ATPase [Burkholderiales bacterium]